MKTTVLVVDDDLSIRDLIHFTLEQAGYPTLRAESAERALALIRDTVPTLALLDWVLPGMSGLTLMTRLRQAPRTANIPIIMVSGNTDTTHQVMGLEQGADDYIAKPFSPRELIARMRAVIRRRAPESSDLSLIAGPLKYDPVGRCIAFDGVKLPLRATELELLRLLMAHPNRVFSREQLLNRVWGDHVFVEERTVDVHVRRLRSVLGQCGRDVIGTVRGGGYKLVLGEVVRERLAS